MFLFKCNKNKIRHASSLFLKYQTPLLQLWWPNVLELSRTFAKFHYVPRCLLLDYTSYQIQTSIKFVPIYSALLLVTPTCIYSCVGSRGLLQPDQHAVRYHHGVLHGGVVRRDVGGAQVRVPLGRRAHRQEAHQVLRAQVHRLPHDVGAGPARRRNSIPL